MNKKYIIGIIGKGFVGTAVAHGFSQGVGYDADILIHDKDPSKSQNTLKDVVNNADFIFVSVPTPSNKDGSINLDIVDDVINNINNISSENNPIILLRSTIVPGTSRIFQGKYPNTRIVFNPEFLTERSAVFDFLSQTRYVLGGEEKNTSKVAELYRDRFGKTISIIETDFESAELIKYLCNCFFATKVSFMNEMRQISDKVGADWDTVVEGFVRDGRVGHSHINVPGPDGKFGFGGSCFPKDVQAMIEFFKNNGLEASTLEGVWKTNLKVRPEKDWEKLKGRAVIE
tara:strand:- start:16482 stop:17342 length:861 start_codon:yes stop_codon:yes gene_type:complete